MLRTRWSWRELEETPQEVVDAVIEELAAERERADQGQGQED